MLRLFWLPHLIWDERSVLSSVLGPPSCLPLNPHSPLPPFLSFSLLFSSLSPPPPPSHHVFQRYAPACGLAVFVRWARGSPKAPTTWADPLMRPSLQLSASMTPRCCCRTGFLSSRRPCPPRDRRLPPLSGSRRCNGESTRPSSSSTSHLPAPGLLPLPPRARASDLVEGQDHLD